MLSSSGWLSPALAAMELCQMCVQGMWDRDPVLMQLPHVTKEVAARASAAGIESIFDLMEMEDDERTTLLAMSAAQLGDVARVCNRYLHLYLSTEPSFMDGAHDCMLTGPCPPPSPQMPGTRRSRSRSRWRMRTRSPPATR